MKTLVPLRVGVEYQLFTRFGVRKGRYSHGMDFWLTDCTHPMQNAAMASGDVYVVDRLTEYMPVTTTR